MFDEVEDIVVEVKCMSDKYYLYQIISSNKDDTMSKENQKCRTHDIFFYE